MKGLTYVWKDHSAGGKESLNLFEPLFGAAPASLIVTSVASLPCEKLYPSNTPNLNVFASVPLPLKSPVAILLPCAVRALTPSTTRAKDVPEPVVAD